MRSNFWAFCAFIISALCSATSLISLECKGDDSCGPFSKFVQDDSGRWSIDGPNFVAFNLEATSKVRCSQRNGQVIWFELEEAGGDNALVLEADVNARSSIEVDVAMSDFKIGVSAIESKGPANVAKHTENRLWSPYDSFLALKIAPKTECAFKERPPLKVLLSEWGEHSVQVMWSLFL